MNKELPIESSPAVAKPDLSVPFFRPHIGEDEINEVVTTLRSGWLTSGPQVKEFERQFAESVNAKFALALNSCTAALHLAVEAIGLKKKSERRRPSRRRDMAAD